MKLVKLLRVVTSLQESTAIDLILKEVMDELDHNPRC